MFVLFSLSDIHNDSLAEFPPGVCCALRDSKAKRDKRKEKDKEGEMHLALHHTWEESGMVWANDVVLKLAKHCKQHALSLDGLWLVSPHHRIFQRCCPPTPQPHLHLFHWNGTFVCTHIPRHLMVLRGEF